MPAGHAGQTLWDLTLQMYNYHNNLRVPHAASSPWWAWPLNLKPVWFYPGLVRRRDHRRGHRLGEPGRLLDGHPRALLFRAVAAWRRRSLPLTLVVLLFLAMWLPWARIDRATFQYHYYTSVPFVVLALAYLLAELWHGPARLAWLMTRVAAALCILGPSLMWLGALGAVRRGERRGDRRRRPGVRRLGAGRDPEPALDRHPRRPRARGRRARAGLLAGVSRRLPGRASLAAPRAAAADPRDRPRRGRGPRRDRRAHRRRGSRHLPG
ncbi:MAG: hypothetical protein R3C32_04385 [Chloroflexota bacterium]